MNNGSRIQIDSSRTKPEGITKKSESSVLQFDYYHPPWGHLKSGIIESIGRDYVGWNVGGVSWDRELFGYMGRYSCSFDRNGSLDGTLFVKRDVSTNDFDVIRTVFVTQYGRPDSTIAYEDGRDKEAFWGTEKAEIILTLVYFNGEYDISVNWIERE